MNRIIIIGNGFDLAHGLKTKYENFIIWYQKEWVEKLKKCFNNTISDELCAFKIFQYDWDYFFSFYHYENISWEDLLETINDSPQLLEYTPSRFFERITTCIEQRNWVDIEKEYYNLLSLDFDSSDDESIEKLNKELECLRTQLISYLRKIENDFINESIVKDSIKEKIFEPINPRDISISACNNILPSFIKKRFPNNNNDENLIYILKAYSKNIKETLKKIREFEALHKHQITNMGIESINCNDFPLDLFYPDNILLLNFNYTRTADLYLPNEEIFKVNHIHGDLSDKSNIIFGYGDELDDNYKNILKQDNNEYLKNIKSINYLNSTNYREMLSYIESSPYQIYIMGHSCGLSDKTLLNTLFEHDNCVSIKPFYYINNEGFDNYTEIVQNISRNFTDMKLMRDRVVNKTFCETLE